MNDDLEMFACVVLTQEVTEDGPEGTTFLADSPGTIVGIHNDGELFDVELYAPDLDETLGVLTIQVGPHQIHRDHDSEKRRAKDLTRRQAFWEIDLMLDVADDELAREDLTPDDRLVSASVRAALEELRARLRDRWSVER